MRTLNRKPIMIFALVLVAALVMPAAQTLTDDQVRIVNQVQKRIASLSNYGVFDDISFRIEGNKITLLGKASRPTLSSSAERVIAKIEGVGSVDNQIVVLSNSRFDNDVRANAYVNIYAHSTLSRYNPNRGTPVWMSPARFASGITNDPPRGSHPIHIIVDNGNVTLEGVVASEFDKQIAGVQANSASGAFSVTNNLLVVGARKAD